MSLFSYISYCSEFVQAIALFVVIFGINTMSDISKVLYVISRAVRRVKFKTILKYHKWYLCQISGTNHAIICLYYYSQKVCNFYMQVFQIKPKYHYSKPIKQQKFLMQQYKPANLLKPNLIVISRRLKFACALDIFNKILNVSRGSTDIGLRRYLSPNECLMRLYHLHLFLPAGLTG